jgi:hypothetical protein
MAPSLSHLSAITLSSSTSHHLHVNFRRRGSPLLFNISFILISHFSKQSKEKEEVIYMTSSFSPSKDVLARAKLFYGTTMFKTKNNHFNRFVL